MSRLTLKVFKPEKLYIYRQVRNSANQHLKKTKMDPIFNSKTYSLDLLENTIFMSKELVNKCPYCGSSNIDQSSEKESKCLECGMGKYVEGKH